MVPNESPRYPLVVSRKAPSLETPISRVSGGSHDTTWVHTRVILGLGGPFRGTTLEPSLTSLYLDQKSRRSVQQGF